MDKKPYHHGDLRNALIEAGIDLINEKGIDQFSLRKIASICGVSHTAPYVHFKDVGAIMAAMSEHVALQFADRLKAAIDEPMDDTMAGALLGKAYISFFTEYPNYFQFLFYHSGIFIDLDNENDVDYLPFALFRDTVYKILDKRNLPYAEKKQILITMWAKVHGITALLTSKTVQYSGDWLDILHNMN